MESWECKLRDFFGAKYFALITTHTHDKKISKAPHPTEKFGSNPPPPKKKKKKKRKKKICGISKNAENGGHHSPNRPKL